MTQYPGDEYEQVNEDWHGPAHDPFAPPTAQGAIPPPRQSNGLGTAGMITSIVGLSMAPFTFCCAPGFPGLLSIIGLVMSAVAMKDEPKGQAKAGVIMGIIGILINLLVLGAFIALAVFSPQSTGMTLWEEMDRDMEMSTLITEVEAIHSVDGVYPASLDAMNLPAESTTDPWGNAYLIYPAADGMSCTVQCIGPDGLVDTFDDEYQTTP